MQSFHELAVYIYKLNENFTSKPSCLVNEEIHEILFRGNLLWENIRSNVLMLLLRLLLLVLRLLLLLLLLLWRLYFRLRYLWLWLLKDRIKRRNLISLPLISSIIIPNKLLNEIKELTTSLSGWILILPQTS